MQSPLLASDARSDALQPAVEQPAPPPPRPPPPSSRALRRVFLLLMSVSFLDAVEYGIIMPSLYQYLRKVGGGLPEDSLGSYYGIILASFSFSSMCVKPVLGAWCDARSFREVYLATFSVSIAGNIVYAFAELLGSWHFLLIGRLLSGVGAANSALSAAYITRAVEPSQLTPYLSKISLAFPLGLVVGPAVNGVTALVDFKLGPLELDDKNSPGALLALLQLLQMLALLFLLVEPPAYSEEARENTRLQGWWHSLLHAMCQPCVHATPFWTADHLTRSLLDLTLTLVYPSPLLPPPSAPEN